MWDRLIEAFAVYGAMNGLFVGLSVLPGSRVTDDQLGGTLKGLCLLGVPAGFLYALGGLL